MPESPISSAEERRIRVIAESLADTPGALLPILHAVQNEHGYVPASAASIIADVLNISRAEVHGVVTFYHFFRTTPPGKKTLYICRAEACQAMGARSLEQYAREKLGIGYHDTTSDCSISLEPVYCLGNCACSPAVMLDETVHGRVTPDRLDEILK